MSLRQAWRMLAVAAALGAVGSVPAAAVAQGPTNVFGLPAAPVQGIPNTCEGGLIGYTDYLFWGAHRQGMDVALTNVGNSLAVHEIGYGRESGFRLGIGWKLPNCWDLSWNYSYFSTDGALGLETPVGGTIVQTQDLGFFGLAPPAGSQFDYAARLNYNVNDLEFGRRIDFDPSTSMRLFAGFRWAMIDQRLTAEYRPAAGAAVAETGTQTIDLDAYGIRLGTEGRWILGRGFSVFGQGSASVLSGHFDYRTVDAVAGGPTAEIRDSATQVVPVLDAAAGVAWRYSNFEVAVGYELASWFNMGGRYTALGLGGVAAPPPDQTLLLDGFFLRAALTR